MGISLDWIVTTNYFGRVNKLLSITYRLYNDMDAHITQI